MLTQLLDHLGVGRKNAHGAIGLVSDHAMGIDTEVVIDGGQHVAEMNGSVDGGCPELVGRPDHLTDLHAATSENRRVDSCPVIAPGILVDLGRAAELTPDHHGDVAIKPAGVDVLNQCRDSLVKEWKMLAQVREVAAMGIPESIPQRHTAHPGLGQASGNQKLVIPHRRTITQVAR